MKKIFLATSLVMISASSFAAAQWHKSLPTEVQAEFAEESSVQLTLNHSASLNTDKLGRDDTLATLTATSKEAGLIGFHWKSAQPGQPSAALLQNGNDPQQNVEVTFVDQSGNDLVASDKDANWFVTKGATNNDTKSIVHIRPTIDDQPVTPGSYSGTLEAARYVE